LGDDDAKDDMSHDASEDHQPHASLKSGHMFFPPENYPVFRLKIAHLLS
jgi:hypothetical protein